MADVQTTIERVEFIIQPEQTICNVFYSSNEPGHMAWGGGWKTKTFLPTKTAVDILNENVKDYILWDSGRQGITENT